MKIYADDGREFKNIDECNAYEADLRLKKEKAEVERIEKERKLQEASKYKQEKIDAINLDFKNIRKKVNECEDETGTKLEYCLDPDGNFLVRERRCIQVGEVDVSTWGSWIDEFLKSL